MRLSPNNLIYLTLLLWFFSGQTGFAAGLKCEEMLLYRGGLSPVVKSNSFVTSRDLSEYRGGLHKGFKASLDSLKPQDTWIDLGAGKGNAATDYFKESANPLTKANVVLITYKLDRWFGIPKFKNKLSVMQGRLFEAIPALQIPKAKLITDFFGVLSYTRDLSRSLYLIFDRLEVGGELYIYSHNMNTVIDYHNKIYSLTDFLKQIEGLEVEGRHGILKITKLADDIQIPDLFLTRLNEDEKPAFRRFSN